MNLAEKREVTGEHNGEKFTFEAGILSIFDQRWSREKIKTLVEVANLLEHHGYKLTPELPRAKATSHSSLSEFLFGPYGLPPSDDPEEE